MDNYIVLKYYKWLIRKLKAKKLLRIGAFLSLFFIEFLASSMLSIVKATNDIYFVALLINVRDSSQRGRGIFAFIEAYGV